MKESLLSSLHSCWGNNMCVCTYVYMYTHICMYKCIYVLSIYVCIYTHIYTHTYTYTICLGTSYSFHLGVPGFHQGSAKCHVLHKCCPASSDFHHCLFPFLPCIYFELTSLCTYGLPPVQFKFLEVRDFDFCLCIPKS